MKEKLLEIKKLIEEIIINIENSPGIETEGSKETTVEELKQEVKKTNFIPTQDFELLRKLLFSDEWPEAVFGSQIADENSETDKEERAEGICDILLPPLKDKKFLDFGCGEGHVSKYMSANCAFSVGYDIERKQKSKLNWEDIKENYLLTTDFEKVKNIGPYDVILLYDVLDHVKESDKLESLLKAKSVLSESGTIYMRCHPWSGRHGGHVYKQINKAFVHLVFSSEELEELGVGNLEYNSNLYYPLAFYRNIIEKSGFKIEKEEIDSQEVENFFRDNPLAKQRILTKFNLKSWESLAPSFQMSQCFVDYVLKIK